MAVIKVLSKGYYNRPQPDNFVKLKKYIFAQDSKTNKKFLLLDFINERDEILSGIKFNLVQLNSAGKIILNQVIFSGEIFCRSNEEISLRKRINISPKCSSFYIEQVEADYSGFIYKQSGNSVVSYYGSMQVADEKVLVPEEVRRAGVVKKSRKSKRAMLLNLPATIVFAILIAVLTYISFETASYYGQLYCDHSTIKNNVCVECGKQNYFSETIDSNLILGSSYVDYTNFENATDREIKSFDISDNQIASITVYAWNEMEVSFEYCVSSEARYDYFYINWVSANSYETETLVRVSGEYTNQFYRKLNEGERLIIVYQKDNTGSGGTDNVTIRDMTLTINYNIN